MKVLSVLLVPLWLVPTGAGLKIEVNVTARIVAEGTPLMVKCSANDTDVDVAGEIRRLAIESVAYHHVEPEFKKIAYRTYKRKSGTTAVLKQVVTLRKSGQIAWGDGYGDRALASRGEGPGITSLTVVISHTRCIDGPVFICVMTGVNSTFETKPTPQWIRVQPVPQPPSITGGRSWSASPRDRCEIYARFSERVDLTCSARVGNHSLGHSITWFKEGGGQKEQLIGNISLQNSTDHCSWKASSRLLYYHGSTEDHRDATLMCSLEFVKPGDNFRRTIYSTVSICTEGGPIERSGYSEVEIVGLFFAGVGTMLFIVLVLLVLVVCCCGYRLRVTKKAKLNVQAEYHANR